MDLSNYLTLDVVFSFVILIAVIIYIFSYSNRKETLKNTNKDTKNNNKPQENQKTQPQQSQQPQQPQIKTSLNDAKKVLYYFGGHHCPHSNRNSRMFNFVINKFSTVHPDVAIVVYWGDNENEQSQFRKYEVEYVPTIVNNNGNKIKVGLPDGYDTGGQTDEELENVVIQNLYEQLN